MRAVLGGAGLAAILAVLTAAPAAAAGCPALDYQAGLSVAATDLGRTPPDLAGAQREIQVVAQVAGGDVPALQPVFADLAAAPPAITDAEQRLASMSATLAYPAGSVCNENAGAARSALHATYSSPDFRHLDDPPQTSLLAQVAGFVQRLIAALGRALGPLGAILLALVVVGLGLLVAWRLWRSSAALRGAVLDEPATPGDDAGAEWDAAEAAAARGDYREATRRAFRSALVDVAVRGHLHLDAAWTSRELLERIDAAPEVLVSLAAAAELFQRAWYSGRPVSEKDWSAAAERCRTVRRLAGRQVSVTR